VAGLTSGGGLITYDETTNKVSLSENKRLRWRMKKALHICLGHSNWPWARSAAVPRITESFRRANGMGWHEHG